MRINISLLVVGDVWHFLIVTVRKGSCEFTIRVLWYNFYHVNQVVKLGNFQNTNLIDTDYCMHFTSTVCDIMYTFRINPREFYLGISIAQIDSRKNFNVVSLFLKVGFNFTSISLRREGENFNRDFWFYSESWNVSQGKLQNKICIQLSQVVKIYIVMGNSLSKFQVFIHVITSCVHAELIQ